MKGILNIYLRSLASWQIAHFPQKNVKRQSTVSSPVSPFFFSSSFLIQNGDIGARTWHGVHSSVLIFAWFWPLRQQPQKKPYIHMLKSLKQDQIPPAYDIFVCDFEFKRRWFLTKSK